MRDPWLPEHQPDDDELDDLLAQAREARRGSGHPEPEVGRGDGTVAPSGLADVPPGEYRVIVRHVGFAPFARAVAVHGPTNLAVMLRRAPVWVEPVTITATRAPSAALGSPLSAAALSEDGLRRDQSVSLAHSLARLPGVNALTTGAQIGKPMIRGLAGARVLVLANGNRLEDYSWR